MASRVLTSLGSLFRSELQSYGEPLWRPAADVYRGAGGWLVKLDLAGVRPEDVQITTSGRRLEVRGTRRDWTATEGEQAYSMEIVYHRFERVLELPCVVEDALAGTEFRDGMLLIRIQPRKQAP